jgi:hypothetical protein
MEPSAGSPRRPERHQDRYRSAHAARMLTEQANTISHYIIWRDNTAY